MADEPSNSELAWRLEAIQRSVAELVGRPEYTARQESAERRFAELAADVQALGGRIDGHEKAHKADHQTWRLIIYTIVIPALVVLIDHFATLLIGGGK